MGLRAGATGRMHIAIELSRLFRINPWLATNSAKSWPDVDFVEFAPVLGCRRLGLLAARRGRSGGVLDPKSAGVEVCERFDYKPCSYAREHAPVGKKSPLRGARFSGRNAHHLIGGTHTS